MLSGPKAPSAVDRALAALTNSWCGGWDLVNATGRVNDNAVARDCHAAALRRGLQWHYIEVNATDDGPGHDHRLWCVTARGGRLPGHRAIEAGAVVVSDPDLAAMLRPHLARTEREVAGRGKVASSIGAAARPKDPVGQGVLL